MRRFITSFTTTNEHENCLETSDNIRDRLMEVLSIDDNELTRRLNAREIKAKFTIFFVADNKVSVNNGHWNDLLEDIVYMTIDYVHLGSIRIENGTTAKIMMTLE